MKLLNVIRGFFLYIVFGIIVISGISFFSPAAIAGVYEAEHIPWSGYWWPFKYGGLATGNGYRGHPAPLEKYLLLTTGKMSGNAVDWYKEHYYNPDAESWWGLCPPFSRAAVTESYPILPSSENNIIFRVGDKKGLLTLCHDDWSGIIYASGETPVDFHFWLLDYIGEQQTAFTADLDAGEEVWYFPVYHYEMDSTRSGQTDHVSVGILYASDSVKPDYIGTKARLKQYTYDLFLDDQGNIIGGEWTGESADSAGDHGDHPETLSFPEVTGALNPYLDCEKIREIARARDDFLEMPDNASARLLPGTYNLVLLNEDVYILPGAPGDEVVLDFTKDDSSRRDMNIEILDNDGVQVRQHRMTQYGPPVSFLLPMENPPYTVVITQADYEADPNIYTLVMDFQAAFVHRVSYIPKNGPWSGFALTNGNDEPADDVMLVTTDTDGHPIQTVLGPLELLPGEKSLFHFSSLPVRKHESIETDSLMLISSQSVDMVNLFADTGGPMAGFSQIAPSGNRLIIPDIYDNEPGNPLYMTGAVINESFAKAEITCDVYSAQGALISTVLQNIAVRGKFQIRPGSSPFYNVSDGGWMEISADNSNIALCGYQYLRNKANQANALDTLFALSVASGTMYVQHVTPPDGQWRTLLTLINPNEDANPVIIHPARSGVGTASDIQVALAPFEKQVIDISPDFGDPASGELERSILEISGSYPFAGYVAYAAYNGDAAFYPLLDADESFKTELIMPHAAYNNGRWWTGVGVCNPNSYPVKVLIVPYDQNGQAMIAAGEYRSLKPGAYEVFTVKGMFDGLVQDISFLKIRSYDPDTALIGGFYLYGNAPGQNLKARMLVSGGNM
ncbi:MAG: hypothetical protein ACKVE4_10895 [Dissulfuribacterales bacterium]